MRPVVAFRPTDGLGGTADHDAALIRGLGGVRFCRSFFGFRGFGSGFDIQRPQRTEADLVFGLFFGEFQHGAHARVGLARDKAAGGFGDSQRSVAFAAPFQLAGVPVTDGPDNTPLWMWLSPIFLLL